MSYRDVDGPVWSKADTHCLWCGEPKHGDQRFCEVDERTVRELAYDLRGVIEDLEHQLLAAQGTAGSSADAGRDYVSARLAPQVGRLLQAHRDPGAALHRLVREMQAAYSVGLSDSPAECMRWLAQSLAALNALPLAGSSPTWYATDAWGPGPIPPENRTAADGVEPVEPKL